MGVFFITLRHTLQGLTYFFSFRTQNDVICKHTQMVSTSFMKRILEDTSLGVDKFYWSAFPPSLVELILSHEDLSCNEFIVAGMIDLLMQFVILL